MVKVEILDSSLSIITPLRYTKEIWQLIVVYIGRNDWLLLYEIYCKQEHPRRSCDNIESYPPEQEDNYNGYLFKLNLKKDYNMVHWNCLIEVIRLTGFEIKWLTLIDLWYKSTMFKVFVIDREACKEISMQGDYL